MVEYILEGKDFSPNKFGKKPLKSLIFFLLDVNFENLTIKLRVFYILNIHVKFHLSI